MLGTSGPPLVVWAAGTGWEPPRIRATFQGVFLPMSLFAVLGHSLAGLWTAQTAATLLTGLPAIAMGTLLGNVLAERIPAARFQRLLYGSLLVLGAALLWPR